MLRDTNSIWDTIFTQVSSSDDLCCSIILTLLWYISLFQLIYFDFSLLKDFDQLFIYGVSWSNLSLVSAEKYFSTTLCLFLYIYLSVYFSVCLREEYLHCSDISAPVLFYMTYISQTMLRIILGTDIPNHGGVQCIRAPQLAWYFLVKLTHGLSWKLDFKKQLYSTILSESFYLLGGILKLRYYVYQLVCPPYRQVYN